MTDTVTVALLSAAGTLGAAGIGALSGFLTYRRKRKDAKADKGDNVTKALRYLMLYVIQERAKELISQGEATLDDRRGLHHWHDLYHNGLGGNGDADRLMQMVDSLPLPQEESRHDL